MSRKQGRKARPRKGRRRGSPPSRPNSILDAAIKAGDKAAVAKYMREAPGARQTAEKALECAKAWLAEGFAVLADAPEPSEGKNWLETMRARTQDEAERLHERYSPWSWHVGGTPDSEATVVATLRGDGGYELTRWPKTEQEARLCGCFALPLDAEVVAMFVSCQCGFVTNPGNQPPPPVRSDAEGWAEEMLKHARRERIARLFKHDLQRPGFPKRTYADLTRKALEKHFPGTGWAAAARMLTWMIEYEGTLFDRERMADKSISYFDLFGADALVAGTGAERQIIIDLEDPGVKEAVAAYGEAEGTRLAAEVMTAGIRELDEVGTGKAH